MANYKIMTNRQLCSELRAFQDAPGKALVDAIVDRLLGIVQPDGTPAYDPARSNAAPVP